MVMEKQDHYSVLGVARTASKDTIRKAYKLKALQLHPDKNPNGEAVFKQVVNAYQTLNDPSKRTVYDRELTRGERGFGTAMRAPARHQPPTKPATKTAGSPAHPSKAYKPEDGASRKPHFTSDEQLFRDAYAQYRKNPFASSKEMGGDFRGTTEGTFSEWFKKKQEELRHVEEVTRAKAQYAKKLEQEEKQRAEEWRDMQRKREAEREQEAERVRAQRERERERMRVESEAMANAQRAEEQRVRMAELSQLQKSQQLEMDRHLRELAAQKAELEAERHRMAGERERATQLAEENRGNRFEVKRQREEELAKAVARAEEKVREVQGMKAVHEAQERMREVERRREEKQRQEEEERQRQEATAMETARKEAEAQEHLARRRASTQLGQQRKRVMELMMKERQKQENDVAEMRRETDRIEAEMRAKLDALREAKKLGQPINLDEWKL